MRSETAKRILSETSDETKQKVRDYANQLIEKKMEAKDNNGWIKIESEADLPKESGAYWITVYSELSNAPFWYNGFEKTFTFRNFEFKFNEVSHYQPIIKPLKPIY